MDATGATTHLCLSKGHWVHFSLNQLCKVFREVNECILFTRQPPLLLVGRIVEKIRIWKVTLLISLYSIVWCQNWKHEPVHKMLSLTYKSWNGAFQSERSCIASTVGACYTVGNRNKYWWLLQYTLCNTTQKVLQFEELSILYYIMDQICIVNICRHIGFYSNQNMLQPLLRSTYFWHVIQKSYAVYMRLRTCALLVYLSFLVSVAWLLQYAATE